MILKKTLSAGGAKLTLLNTLEAEHVMGYAIRSTPWINDPEVNQYLGRQSTTLEQSLEWYRKLAAKLEQDRSFAIWHNQVHIGNCGIHHINQNEGYATLGIVIGDKTFQSRGIGTDVMFTLCLHAFDELHLRKLDLQVVGHNLRAIACYEKCGFKEVGRKKDHHFRAGTYQDDITMEVFRDDFMSKYTLYLESQNSG